MVHNERKGQLGCFLVFSAMVAASAVAYVVTGPQVSEQAFGEIPVAEEPTQIDLDEDEVAPIPWTWQDRSFSIVPLARYRIAAVVVGTKRYRGGWQGAIAPWDVGLAWGQLDDDALRAQIGFTQSSRWLFWSLGADLPVTIGYVMGHAANNHVIPATENIERAIARLAENERIEAEGYLVRVEGEFNGTPIGWRSSLSREDTGDQSCEVFYVERLRVGDDIYV